jgi:hypothetical protein
VNTANYTGTASGTLVIQKAPATATTGIYVINKNAPLPTFTATYSGFLAGQTASVVTSVSFSTSPNYTGNAGVYQIIVNAQAANYTFTSVNGTLYVNPAGPGTKQVKPNFVCIEALTSPGPGGFMFVAHFTYTNQNSTPVYIPVGPNNSTSGASHLAINQPVVFQPGGGSWNVPFNNIGQLTWQIRSNKNDGTVGSIQANSSNVQCNGVTQSMVAEEEEEEGIAPAPSLNTRVYPNPSSGKVFLEFEADAEASTIEVYNTLGVKCPVNIVRPADQLIELDLGAYGKGMYIIQVNREGNLATFRVVIE